LCEPVAPVFNAPFNISAERLPSTESRALYPRSTPPRRPATASKRGMVALRNSTKLRTCTQKTRELFDEGIAAAARRGHGPHRDHQAEEGLHARDDDRGPKAGLRARVFAPAGSGRA